MLTAQKGIKWELSFEEYQEIVEDKACYYCSGPLSVTGLGLDRIDSGRGYSKDNVVPCCGGCNAIKGRELTQKETKLLIDKLRKIRNIKKPEPLYKAPHNQSYRRLNGISRRK